MDQEQRRNVALAVAIAADGRPQYVIAADAQINPNTLSGVMHGRVTARPEVRSRIAGALGRPEQELFETTAADV